jgi:RNA polymerase sigma factor for flagellar operon FliA
MNRFEENTTWALKIAKDLTRDSHWPRDRYEEISNAALVGLWQAANRFEDNRVSFRSYAYWRIRGAIQDELRTHYWWPAGEKRAKREGSAAPPYVSRVGISGEVGKKGFELIAAPTPLSVLEITDEARVWVRRVPRNHREAMRLYFLEGLAMKEVGRRLGVTESRIQQIVTQEIKRLKTERELADAST